MALKKVNSLMTVIRIVRYHSLLTTPFIIFSALNGADFLMEYDRLPAGFWSDLIIIMVIVVIALSVIPVFLRRRMGADKMNWFSHNYINAFHKKGDWILHIVYVISVICCAAIITIRPFIIFLVLGLFAITQLCFRAYVEWKYSDNRVNYKASLIEVGLTLFTITGLLLWLFDV
ncbi:DUF4181 domain-containing protein [Virgibacillus sp. 179-BFC.A HS]|uniref:DUF4181 domain-containing protein n=1 Tax=Tigheibacillus jepli TaxID=3035914 RepID=A0ABU5CI90_9BACI|nr:DUF4181 domain-containing protein [Virgibacillus sp. 179-BFC.A HS]MDY0405220.1 DUF4181 domain-containing protein [Virgibacillus sp. 179-BFC.A HS]